jgi:hypothetical protein
MVGVQSLTVRMYWLLYVLMMMMGIVACIG